MAAATSRDLYGLAKFGFEQSSDAIFSICNGLLLHANPSACQLFGYTIGEVTQVSLDQILVESAAEFMVKAAASNHTGESVVLKTVFRRKDGNCFTAHLNTSAIEVNGDKVIYAIVHDHFHAKVASCQNRDELPPTRKGFRLTEPTDDSCYGVGATSRDGIVISEDGIIHDVNQAFLAISGYERNEALGRTLEDVLIPPKRDVPGIGGESAQTAIYEMVGTRKDGSLLDLEVVGRSVYKEGRRMQITTLRDISSRRQSIRETLAARNRLELAMAGARLGTFEWVIAEGGGEVSDSFFRLFGREPGTVRPTYREFARHAHSDDLQRLERIFGLAQKTGKAIAQEARIFWPDGSMHWVEVRAKFAYDSTGQAIRLDGVMVDIDEKKNAETRFEKSQLNLLLALKSGNMGTYEWQIDSGKLEQSPEAKSITGWETVGTSMELRKWISLVHPSDRASVIREFGTARRNGGDVVLEYRLRDSQGRYRWLETRGRFTCDRHGRAIRVTGVVTNVDHRKHAEEELRLRRFAVDVAAEAMFTLQSSGAIVDVNQTACERLGYSREELLQMHVKDFSTLPTETFEQHVAVLRQSTSRCLRTTHRRKDGTSFEVEVSARLFEYEGHEYICATARDVTELRMAEEKMHRLDQQLTHVNRLSSMGEMASTIAHELNQPLYVITNMATLLQHQTAKNPSHIDQEMKHLTETIQAQAILAGDIVRRMRGFCLNKPPTRTRVDLQDLVTESMNLLAPKLRHSFVRTEIDFDDASNALIDRVQIQQVLVNLVHNAIEAMTSIPSEKRHLHVCTKRLAGDCVRISVTDSGPGIPFERRSDLFEPFISTKDNGMGMGLAISRSIIEAHNGRLTLDVAGEVGTTLRIDIPSHVEETKTL